MIILCTRSGFDWSAATKGSFIDLFSKSADGSSVSGKIFTVRKQVVNITHEFKMKIKALNSRKKK